MTDFFRGLADTLRSAEAFDWHTQARTNQLPPPGDWRIWLLLAGRGFGKTRTICEFVRAEVESGRACRVALLGATAADVRDVLVAGHSGLLAISPEWNRPTYEPTKRLLTWKNGAIATMYSADEPDRLRGPQFDLAVCDELAAWRYPEALDMLLLGLRIGKNPRVAIATTPRPTKVIRDLLAREGKDVAVTRGSTLDNRDNLAPAYVEQIIERYKGTRLERQEVFGEVLEDTPGALWNRDLLEQTRVESVPKDLQRIVIAIDPAGSSEEGADETGIVVAAMGQDGHVYVLEDLSGRYAPAEWARRSLGAFHVWKGDRIVCETNFGGEMVRATIEAIDPTAPVKSITSSRGKVLRAEPIAAIFEQRKAHMVGALPELEDQMCRFTSNWTRARDGSPDRVDAMVFAAADLALGLPVGGVFREHSLHVAGEPVEPPKHPDVVYAVIASAAALDPEHEGVGVVFFAYSQHGQTEYPLYVLTWELAPSEYALRPEWLGAVFARLEALRLEVGALSGRTAAYIDPSAVGGALLKIAVERGFDAADVVDAAPQCPTDLPGRATAAARFVGSGAVRLTRQAAEHVSVQHGVRRNHLLAEVLGYQATQAPGADALVSAFAAGVVLGLEGSAPYAQPAEPERPPEPSAEELAERERRHAAYLVAYAEWERARDAEIAAIRARNCDPYWLPFYPTQLKVGPAPTNSFAGFKP